MAGWAITYMGEGVTAVEGVGVFQRWTTAYVSEDVATTLRGDSRWTVTGPDGKAVGGKAASAPPAPPAPPPPPAEPEKAKDKGDKAHAEKGEEGDKAHAEKGEKAAKGDKPHAEKGEKKK